MEYFLRLLKMINELFCKLELHEVSEKTLQRSHWQIDVIHALYGNIVVQKNDIDYANKST